MQNNLLGKILVLSILLVVVVLSGCNESNNSDKSDEDRITGTWIVSEPYEDGPSSIIYIFLSDKTFEVIATFEGYNDSFNGNWKIVDNKLVSISCKCSFPVHK